ncbi:MULTISPECIES: YwqJ-related putative deaminase [Kitasatospora]|uniref:YwqJ-like deaminase n=1 Tax=Kitasatospora cystarginea TaxID=58350 RepID=A0ABN3ENL2_9ACTN
MTNPIVQALEGGAKKLGKALTEDAGKAVRGLYHDTANGAKKVVENTAKTDAEHASALTKILSDGKHEPVHKPHTPGEPPGGSGHPGRNPGGPPGGGFGGGHPGGGAGGGSHPQGRPMDPQPSWHGKSAGEMKHHRLPAVDVTHLDSADRISVLKNESQKLADAAQKTEADTKKAAEDQKNKVKPKPPVPGEDKLVSGCAGSFEHNGIITAATSTTKRAGQTLPKTHPTVKQALDDILKDSQDGKIGPTGIGHGKCAEVSLISDRLHALDPDGTKIKTVEDAKAALSGGNMHSRQINDMKDKAGNLVLGHGAYKEPCGTCTHLLPLLGINAQD